MQENRSSFAALLIAALVALVAALLFVVALVVWLSEWFGSIVLPCLLVGLFFAAFAVAIYALTLRPAMQRMHEQFMVIYDMMRLARDGVDAVTKLFFRS